MPFQRIYNFVSKATRNSLGNLCMRWVPVLWLRFDHQLNWLLVAAPDFLEMANVDFADQFKPAFRRLFQTLSKHVPMFGKRDQRKSAD